MPTLSITTIRKEKVNRAYNFSANILVEKIQCGKLAFKKLLHNKKI